MNNIPNGFCQCGCGQKTTLITVNCKNRGLVKGTYRQYIHNHHPTTPRNTTPPADRFWKYVNKLPGNDTCWIWTGNKNKNGYGQIHLGRAKEGKELAHRLSYKIAYGEIPEGKNILHRCDNPACVNPSHLFVGDQKDNMQDMLSKGRRGRCGSKVTQEQVIKIRQCYANGDITQRELAEIYGIGRNEIHRIVRLKRWANI